MDFGNEKSFKDHLVGSPPRCKTNRDRQCNAEEFNLILSSPHPATPTPYHLRTNSNKMERWYSFGRALFLPALLFLHLIQCNQKGLYDDQMTGVYSICSLAINHGSSNRKYLDLRNLDLRFLISDLFLHFQIVNRRSSNQTSINLDLRNFFNFFF